MGSEEPGMHVHGFGGPGRNVPDPLSMRRRWLYVGLVEVIKSIIIC